MSDGTLKTAMMLATQHNQLVASGAIGKFSTVKIKEYVKNEVANRSVIICLEIEPVAKHNQQIGNPVMWDESNPTPLPTKPVASKPREVASSRYVAMFVLEW